MPAEVAAAAAEVAADAAVEVEGLFEEAVVGREGKDEERAFALGGFGLCCCLLSIDCEGGMGTCGPPQYCSSMHACMHACSRGYRAHLVRRGDRAEGVRGKWELCPLQTELRRQHRRRQRGKRVLALCEGGRQRAELLRR